MNIKNKSADLLSVLKVRCQSPTFIYWQMSRRIGRRKKVALGLTVGGIVLWVGLYLYVLGSLDEEFQKQIYKQLEENVIPDNIEDMDSEESYNNVLFSSHLELRDPHLPPEEREFLLAHIRNTDKVLYSKPNLQFIERVKPTTNITSDIIDEPIVRFPFLHRFDLI